DGFCGWFKEWGEVRGFGVSAQFGGESLGGAGRVLGGAPVGFGELVDGFGIAGVVGGDDGGKDVGFGGDLSGVEDFQVGCGLVVAEACELFGGVGACVLFVLGVVDVLLEDVVDGGILGACAGDGQ